MGVDTAGFVRLMPLLWDEKVNGLLMGPNVELYHLIHKEI